MNLAALLARLATAHTEDERAWIITANLLAQMPPDLRAMTWAAAIPHWFDAATLAALRPELADRAAALYADLQTLSFVEVFPERGHNIHERTRQLLLDQLWRENPDEFRTLSARAAEFFAGRDEIEFRIAYTCHLLVADPDKGADAVRNLGADLNNTFRFAELETLVNVALEPIRAGRVSGRARGWVYFRKGKLESQSYRPEALETFQSALADADQDQNLQANVLKAMGDVQQFRKNMDAALTTYAQALDLFRAVGDRLGEANVLKAMGDVQQFRKNMDAALTTYAQALDLFRAVGDRLGEANVLQAMGDVQRLSGEHESALKNYDDALPLFHLIGSKLGEANVLASQSRLLVRMGEITKGEQLLEQAIAVRGEIHDLYSQGADYGNFALALVTTGEKAKAKPYALKAKELWRQFNEPSLMQWIDDLIESCE